MERPEIGFQYFIVLQFLLMLQMFSLVLVLADDQDEFFCRTPRIAQSTNDMFA